MGIGIDVNWCNFKQYANKSYYKETKYEKNLIDKKIDYTTPIHISLVIGELSQMLINIINNAKDAFDELKKLKKSYRKN